MEVISLCPLPVAGVLWKTEQRGWSLTVVCKATFELGPGELKLRKVQLPLARAERHYEDEPGHSVHVPADLVPFKPRVDVLVVGHAHAPGGKPTDTLTARMVIAEVDKSIRVIGNRTREGGGRTSAISEWRRLPLRYERAVGGPGSHNPVGVPTRGLPGPDGASLLPNLMPEGNASGMLVGFGPVAAGWPTRKRRLGRHAEGFASAGWFERPLPPELDLAFFNDAPEDQQLESLRGSETVKLWHMHPAHEELAFTLPPLWPQAFFERADGEDELMTMRCDTLWIDTDLEVVTMTWRAQLRLESLDERARVIVAVTDNGAALSRGDLEPLLERAGIGPIDGPTSLGNAIGLEGRELTADGPGRLLEVHAVELAPPTETTTSFDSWSSALSIPSSRPSLLTGNEVMTISSEMLESVPPSDDSIHGPKILKLLWIDPRRVRAIRSQPGWQELLDHHEEHETDRSAHADMRDVHRVLVSAYPASASDVEAAVAEAVGREQEFESPLILSAGELRLSFDELYVLRATVTAAAPFAGQQPELERVLASARELLGTTWLETADGVATELSLRIREAFQNDASGLPPDYLEAQVQRIVVSERRYQRRQVWGRRWVRGSFVPVGARVGFTTYLPEDVAGFLPLFDRFFARLVAQVDLREDQYESHPLALKVLALARVVDAPLAFSRQ
jgi:hypothetical protein